MKGGIIMIPIWSKTLSEVLKHDSEEVMLISEKTGNEYKTEVIKNLRVFSIGSVVEQDGKYKYSVVDTENELEYTIKAPNKIEVKFGMILEFTNVRGGALSNGYGWYSADSVRGGSQNAKV